MALESVPTVALSSVATTAAYPSIVDREAVNPHELRCDPYPGRPAQFLEKSQFFQASLSPAEDLSLFTAY